MPWAVLKTKLRHWAELLSKEGENTKQRVREEICDVINNIDEIEAKAEKEKEREVGWF